MIPIHLSIAGFLSYNERSELDFSSFNLACISGLNGAGKSSLLDSITWALFGQARRRDDAVINSHCDSAEVVFDFEYENNRYRIQRSKTREKSTLLEFYILDGQADKWKTLTEHSVTETENRITQILRMDYETFTNASFFLQGKADQFAQQRPGDRKRILSSILGLEIWEYYRSLSVERRKTVEKELENLAGQMKEIEDEIKLENQYTSDLKEKEGNLSLVSTTRKSIQENYQTQIRQRDSLLEQERSLKMLENQYLNAQKRVRQYQDDLQTRQAEREKCQQQLQSADQIKNEYAQWIELRKTLTQQDQLAEQNHRLVLQKSKPLSIIESEKTRLTTLQNALLAQQKNIENSRLYASNYEQELQVLAENNQAYQEQLNRQVEIKELRDATYQKIQELEAENKQLQVKMNELNDRITRLEDAKGSSCPLCDQPLSPGERQNLADQLKNEGKQLGDQYRENLATKERLSVERKNYDSTLEQLNQVEKQRNQNLQSIATLQARLEQAHKDIHQWEGEDEAKLDEITNKLERNAFALDQKIEVAEIEEKIQKLGYDPSYHTQIRQAEEIARSAEQKNIALEKARSSLEHLEREINALENQLKTEKGEFIELENQFQNAQHKFIRDKESLPDLDQLEKELNDFIVKENQLITEVGGAKNRLENLSRQKERLTQFVQKKDQFVLQLAQIKRLERAFSKDGIPALLIEQALPEIESHTNEILDRLSNGEMSVRFETQRQYKDKNRDDKKETLDILISDSSGAYREYEMFSGGEAFRVNFAIRLALSQVLAKRAGARLQTLVIDEGFGSQDADGRQRLIEAINLVSHDFEKIIVITHLEELKDVFPARIEIEKTPQGSKIKVNVL